jgi:hypothetical protein
VNHTGRCIRGASPGILLCHIVQTFSRKRGGAQVEAMGRLLPVGFGPVCTGVCNDVYNDVCKFRAMIFSVS